MGTGPTKLSTSFRNSDTFDPRFTSEENAYQVYTMENCFPGRQGMAEHSLNKYTCNVTLDDSTDSFEIELRCVGTTPGGACHWLLMARGTPF